MTNEHTTNHNNEKLDNNSTNDGELNTIDSKIRYVGYGQRVKVSGMILFC